jgi:hypothetical protein
MGFAPHRQAVRAVHTRLLEKWEFQIISMIKLKMQDITAEIPSLARAERTNQNPLGTILTCWRN